MLMSESLAVLCELSAPQQREENRSEHHYEDQVKTNPCTGESLVLLPRSDN